MQSMYVCERVGRVSRVIVSIHELLCCSQSVKLSHLTLSRDEEVREREQKKERDRQRYRDGQKDRYEDRQIKTVSETIRETSRQKDK